MTTTAEAPPETEEAPLAEEPEAEAPRTREERQHDVILRQIELVRSGLLDEMKKLRARAIIKYAHNNSTRMCEDGFKRWVINCRLPGVLSSEIYAGRQSENIEIHFPQMPGWHGAALLRTELLTDEGLADLLEATQAAAAKARQVIRHQIVAATGAYITEDERIAALAELGYDPPRQTWTAGIGFSDTYVGLTADLTHADRVTLGQELSAAVSAILATRGATQVDGYLSVSFSTSSERS
jgi:hypothetical protein